MSEFSNLSAEEIRDAFKQRGNTEPVPQAKGPLTEDDQRAAMSGKWTATRVLP